MTLKRVIWCVSPIRKTSIDTLQEIFPLPIPKFKRGCNTSIQSWFFQMKTYFQFAGIPSDLWVSGNMNQVHQCHFEELLIHALLPYPTFKQKMCKFFKAPDCTESLMKEFCELQQEPYEVLNDFRSIVQDIVEKAFRKLPEDTKQNFAVNGFCSGMVDKDIAKIVSFNAKGDVNKALSLAASVGCFSIPSTNSRLHNYKPDKSK